MLKQDQVFTQVKDLVNILCQYSTTSKTEDLKQREKSWYQGSSPKEQKLKTIFRELNNSDIVNIQIAEFSKLLTLL